MEIWFVLLVNLAGFALAQPPFLGNGPPTPPGGSGPPPLGGDGVCSKTTTCLREEIPKALGLDDIDQAKVMDTVQQLQQCVVPCVQEAIEQMESKSGAGGEGKEGEQNTGGPPIPLPAEGENEGGPPPMPPFLSGGQQGGDPMQALLAKLTELMQCVIQSGANVNPMLYTTQCMETAGQPLFGGSSGRQGRFKRMPPLPPFMAGGGGPPQGGPPDVKLLKMLVASRMDELLNDRCPTNSAKSRACVKQATDGKFDPEKLPKPEEMFGQTCDIMKKCDPEGACADDKAATHTALCGCLDGLHNELTAAGAECDVPRPPFCAQQIVDGMKDLRKKLTNSCATGQAPTMENLLGLMEKLMETAPKPPGGENGGPPLPGGSDGSGGPPLPGGGPPLPEGGPPNPGDFFGTGQ